MPELLDYMKEKKLSQEDALNILKEHFEVEIEEEPAEEPAEEESSEEESEEQESEEKEELESISMEELDKKIDEKIKKVLRIKRKVPSKGKIIKKEDIGKEPESVKKNWFEVLV